MLNLSAKNIRLNGSASNKEEVIRFVAAELVAKGNVAAGYEVGMLNRETQTSTFLGNGIAIPHGTLDTRDLVKETGVQIIQLPQGVEWGKGNTAYVVIGIAAKSDEHLTLLRQLTTVLSDEEAAATLAKTQNLDEFIAVLSGKKNLPALSQELISLNIESSSLITLSAINAAKLQEQGYVSQAFISDVVANKALHLGNNLFVVDSAQGNQANGIAIARNTQGQTLLTVAETDNALQPLLTQLLKPEVRSQFAHFSAEQMLGLLKGESVASTPVTNVEASGNQVVSTFTIRNDNGLHARPAAVLVQTVKPFSSKISVENLDRNTAPASAKSAMKVVALGASQGHRLRFVAEGEDAQQAIEALQQAIINGLGESVSFVPAVADTIESIAVSAIPAEETATAVDANTKEATFVIKNEHGLHARPSAVLVNEVKKFNAKIEVQNVDKNSPLVSAKSLMKIVALGVTKGTTLRFVASGDDAEVALAAIGAAIEAGLGE
ncbi:fused PTS fructose transporter subunit IIA/HPr protein [Mannheimia haemolytica]|uniref:Pseudo-HPr n=1 Tax=Mannheimia haemolytica TaxID=75985 RepID=A0A378NAH2_MANHA|nr:fused PTS fructose transporter subunit IIA/HPr protein [Mannheimia haemolytica]TCS90984.1 phosphocarrier protein HPr /PTS system D-fructose-specific IIA component (F1P-forming) (Frc family) [Mannheimia haemolytica]UQX71376.1 fused PTS fructose transporter subunit IIA/HPr protein [Mannheimia haemolytica]STY52182.1 Pseudo-HPr [Mannheimia haemolytica]STY65434.1 Pseudo-HPr [Mannheimia haemolytica]